MPAENAARVPVVHVVTATNAAYLPWAATTLLSAVTATVDAAVHVWLLHDADVGRAALDRTGDCITSYGGVWHTLPVPSERLADLPSGTRSHGGHVSCARFLLPELMPQVARAVYLDADTFVLESLSHLVNLHTDGTILAAVPNVVLAHHRPRIADLGLNPFHYLNSGVLSMDLSAMRRADSSDALLDIVHSFGERLAWVDQDALNLVFADQWTALPARWNSQNSLRFWKAAAEGQFPSHELHAALVDPAILHFEGPSWAKPWHYLSPHPFARRYLAATDRGPFGRQHPSDRTALTRGLRLLGPHRAVRAHDWLVAHRIHGCSR